MNKLKKLLSEGEAIYVIERLTERPIYIIGDYSENPDRELDVSNCIEYTLHCMLDAGWSDDEISEILDTDKLLASDTYDDESGDYYIDLNYVIYDFYPIGLSFSGIAYKRPTNSFKAYHKNNILCKNLIVPDNPTNDEILDVMHDKFGINPDDYIVSEMNDGFIYGVQNLLKNECLFVLKRNADKAA